MSKNDASTTKTLCYFGIFILLLFIVLPPLFRVLFPEEEQKPDEIKKTIMNLTCVKDDDFIEYKLKTTISTNYVDGVINDSTFTYTVSSTDSYFGSRVTIEEYEALKKVPNVEFSEKNNNYILNIDYSKFDYSNEEALDNHKKVISEQMAIYSDDSFECKTTKVQ